jgi:hypothetical protein
MRNTATTVILSVVAIILVLGIGACIATKPLTAIGLAPILAAISLIIKAIRGRPSRRDDPPEQPTDHDHTTLPGVQQPTTTRRWRGRRNRAASSPDRTHP